MRRFSEHWSVGLVIALAILAACGGKAGEILTTDPPGEPAPRILEVIAPDASCDASGDIFTFEVITDGSQVAGTRWKLGSGASPRISAGPKPEVILANFTEEPIESSGKVEVWDAQGRSDMREFSYSVGKRRPNPVGPKVEDLPDIMLPEPETNVNKVPFKVDADDDVAEDEVTVDVAVLDGKGVEVSPSSFALQDPDYKDCEIEVVNTNARRSCVVIGLFLQQGDRRTGRALAGWVNGMRPVYHEPIGDDVIAVEPATDTLKVGEAVNVKVTVYNLSRAVGYFKSIILRYSDNLEPVDKSWNVGAPGGDRWDKDGFFNQFPDDILCIDPHTLDLFIQDDWGEIHVNISGVGWRITGAPAGSSGDVFNVTFKAVDAGKATISFVKEDTFYSPPNEFRGHVDYQQYEDAELLIYY